MGALPVELTDSEMRDLSPPKKSDPDAGEQKYEPTEREKTALDRYRAQKATAPAAPRMEVIDGKKKVTPDHPDQPLAWALLRRRSGLSASILGMGCSVSWQMPVRTAAKSTKTRLILCCQ
jgi:hypothetical protein